MGKDGSSQTFLGRLSLELVLQLKKASFPCPLQAVIRKNNEDTHHNCIPSPSDTTLLMEKVYREYLATIFNHSMDCSRLAHSNDDTSRRVACPLEATDDLEAITQALQRAQL